LQRMIHKHGWGINVLERLPDSERLVFGALNGSVGVIDGRTDALVAELPPHGRPVLALAQRDDLVATGSGDGVIRVFRTSDWRLLHEYRNPFGPVWALAFSRHGNALFYGGLDDFVTLWTFSPREPYEQVDSPFPRRFQLSDASNDPIAQGEIQFARKCSICHTLKPDGANRAGPTLHQVFGRRVASVPGYPYSDALKRLDIVWTEETIARLFELGPEHYTPGSKMPLQRISDAAQRHALVAYLKVATSGQGSDDPAAGGPPPSRQEPKTKGDKP
jgi:cytochrome c